MKKLLMAIIIIPSITYAQTNININDSYQKGFYAGLGLGESRLNTEQFYTQSDVEIDKVTLNQSSVLNYKAFIGYKFNKNFALEGGYFNLGKYEYHQSGNFGDVNGTFKYKGGNLDLIGNAPITNNVSFLGILGTHRGHISNTTTSNIGNLSNMPNPFSGSNGLSYKYGIGLQYKITDNVSIRTTLEKYQFKNNAFKNTNSLTVSVVMPLGR